MDIFGGGSIIQIRTVRTTRGWHSPGGTQEHRHGQGGENLYAVAPALDLRNLPLPPPITKCLSQLVSVPPGADTETRTE